MVCWIHDLYLKLCVSYAYRAWRISNVFCFTAEGSQATLEIRYEQDKIHSEERIRDIIKIVNRGMSI
jgi:hypothetical protein